MCLVYSLSLSNHKFKHHTLLRGVYFFFFFVLTCDCVYWLYLWHDPRLYINDYLLLYCCWLYLWTYIVLGIIFQDLSFNATALDETRYSFKSWIPSITAPLGGRYSKQFHSLLFTYFRSIPTKINKDFVDYKNKRNLEITFMYFSFP